MIDHCYFYGIFYLYPSPIKFKCEIDLTKWNFHDRMGKLLRQLLSSFSAIICMYRKVEASAYICRASS